MSNSYQYAGNLCQDFSNEIESWVFFELSTIRSLYNGRTHLSDRSRTQFHFELSAAAQLGSMHFPNLEARKFLIKYVHYLFSLSLTKSELKNYGVEDTAGKKKELNKKKKRVKFSFLFDHCL